MMFVFLFLTYFILYDRLWVYLTRTNVNSSFLRLSNISLCVWSGLPFPSPGDLPDPRIEPRSPALQADALLSEPPGIFFY